MNHPLPKDKITTLPYKRQIEGFEVEFQLTVTLLGEVLAVSCPILELPATAQRLMFGGNFQQMSAAVKGFTGIFPYATPLIAMGYLDTEEWKSLKEAFFVFKNNQAVPVPITNYIQQDWLKKAYQYHEQGDSKRNLLQIGKLLTLDPQNRYGALKEYNKSIELDYYDPALFGPVILRLLPISKNVATIHAIYQGLATYPTETVYLLLTNRLTNPAHKKYHTSILKGLQPYHQSDLQPILSTFFTNTTLLGGDALNLFISTTMRLQEPQRKELLYKVLTSDNRQAAIKVHYELTRLGMTEEELSKKLYTVFKERRSVENMRAILKLYDRVKNDQLLPKGKELLDVMEWANENKSAIAINHGITPLIKKRLEAKDFAHLLALLKSKKHTIQEAAMKQVSDLAKSEHINQLDSIANEVAEPFQSQLVYQTKKLLERYSQREPIQPLLNLLQSTERLKVETLKPIKQILRYRQQEEAIPPLLKELSNKNADVRKNTLLALRIFKNKQVVNAIEKVAQNDENAIVKKTAKKCLAWIDNPLPESWKIEREKKEKIEDYIEEMISNAEEESGKPLNGISRFFMKAFGRSYYKYFPKEEWRE